MNMDSHTKGKKMQPFISIVVPVYNVEKYINRCIDSVLDQSYANWELLLIDDGSSDNSGKICDSYSMKDNRIRTIHKPNGGVSSARNLGIEQASGDFITFIDSDDWVESDYLQDFVNRNPIKESIVVSGLLSQNPYEVYVSFSYKNEQTSIKFANELIVKYDLFRDGGPTNKLFDLQLIKVNKLNFRTDLSYHEDHIFVFEYYLLINKIILSAYNGYHYMYYGKVSDTSLSRLGREGVNNLFKASDIFLSVIPNLFRYYQISDSVYMAKVLTRTGYAQRILALYNLYLNSDTPNCKCREILHREQCQIRHIKDAYYLPSVKRKLFICVLSLPLSVSHTLLCYLRQLLRFFK